MRYIKTYIGKSMPLFGYRIWFVVIAVSVLLSRMAAVSYAADVKLSDSLENVKISGDFRLRQESFDKKTQGQVDRHRQRFRLRFGTDFAFRRNVNIKLRLASGTGEQVSTNETSGTFGQAVTNEGNRKVGGILQNEFGVAELTGALSAWIGGKLPLSVQGTFIRNTKAKDSLSHILWAAYNPEKWLQAKVKYFTTKVVNETLSPNADDINRIQMDLSVKF